MELAYVEYSYRAKGFVLQLLKYTSGTISFSPNGKVLGCRLGASAWNMLGTRILKALQEIKCA